ncbi:hypothetical protein PUW95_00585 [Metamycoplasma hyosynoviae]|uniref:hypothetical protein n=1 Tax=Metamycoplasma hyosynoviae TaxID=29559 RepID=UPI002366EEF8|nr:hypothetical protein [Metamycoplasma hyosynoviae]MDD7897241.1 hypothetical protein [Metamycoplasma hyosynoviae]
MVGMQKTSENSLNLKIKSQKNKYRKEKQYFVWKDTSFLWTVLILILFSLITISYLNVKGLTTIHSYSINIFFGMFSILFYLWLILFCLKKLFNLKNTYTARFFHFSMWRLATLFLAIIIFGSTIYYVANKIFVTKPASAFKEVFSYWFDEFKTNAVPALPYKYGAGIFGTFFYSLFSIVGNKAGIAISFILSITTLVVALSFFFISDLRFKLLSFSESKRKVARQEIDKIKSKSIRYLLAPNEITITKTSENLDSKPQEIEPQIIKTSEIITPQIQESKPAVESIAEVPKFSPLASQLENKNLQETIGTKPTPKPEIVYETAEPIQTKSSFPPLELHFEAKNQEEKIKNLNIPTSLKETPKPTEVQDAKKEIIEEKKIEHKLSTEFEQITVQPKVDVIFEDDPFYTSTVSLEIVSPAVVASNALNKTIEKTAENYLSKFVSEKELNNFKAEQTKIIDLELQEEHLNKISSKPHEEVSPEENKKNRYAIIQDKEELF